MAELKYKGLLKLNEECAELGQITSKQIAYYGEEIYPDGTDLKERLVEEIGDVLATIEYVILHNMLPVGAIYERKAKKLEKFEKWRNEE